MKLPAFLFAAVLTIPCVNAQTYDLKTDWSDVSNPNGVWSYLVDGVAPSASIRGSDTFGPPGPPVIWGAGHIGWSQSNGSQSGYLDDEIGDIYGHEEIAAPISITWTSPSADTVHAFGGLWAMREGRSNDWSIVLNGVTLQASGVVADGDPFDRNNPNPFDFTTFVNPGDVLELTISPTSGQLSGDYVGANFTVEVIPEPSGTWLVAAGLMLGSLTRKRSLIFTRRT